MSDNHTSLLILQDREMNLERIEILNPYPRKGRPRIWPSIRDRRGGKIKEMEVHGKAIETRWARSRTRLKYKSQQLEVEERGIRPDPRDRAGRSQGFQSGRNRVELLYELDDARETRPRTKPRSRRRSRWSCSPEKTDEKEANLARSTRLATWTTESSRKTPLSIYRRVAVV